MTYQQRQYAESKYQEGLFNIRSRITHLENSRKFRSGESPDNGLGGSRNSNKTGNTSNFLGKLTILE